MSSDESDYHSLTNQPIYRVRVMLWRRDFDAIMDAIDNARLKAGSGYSSKGAKPTLRMRQTRDAADASSSSRQPSSHLPIVYYDDAWLEDQTEAYVEQVLSVSREAFEWVRYFAKEQHVS